GLPLDAALAAPRVHPDGERELRIEEGSVGSWSPAARRALEGAGFTLVPSPSGYFGRVHAVGWDPVRNEAFGVAEPRWNGAAVAPASGSP
ncbi:MAG: hypothetical protein EA351_13705, partial [Gemmatimonadales bacterium]